MGLSRFCCRVSVPILFVQRSKMHIIRFLLHSSLCSRSLEDVWGIHNDKRENGKKKLSKKHAWKFGILGAGTVVPFCPLFSQVRWAALEACNPFVTVLHGLSQLWTWVLKIGNRIDNCKIDFVPKKLAKRRQYATWMILEWWLGPSYPISGNLHLHPFAAVVHLQSSVGLGTLAAADGCSLGYFWSGSAKLWSPERIPDSGGDG